MAEDKNSILVYADWIKKFEALSDEEAGRLIKHFFRYVNDLNPVPPDRITELSFIDIEQSLKRDLRKWENKKVTLSDSGSMGNLKRWHNDIYLKVLKNKITLAEGLIIASDRKSSPPDVLSSPPDNFIAVSVSDSVSVINTCSIDADFSKPKKSATQISKETFDQRKKEFRATLLPFTKSQSNPNGKFEANMVGDFFKKWTEPNKSRTKMKFEMEKTWEVELRLGTWKRNGFGNKNNSHTFSERITQGSAPELPN